MFHTHGGCRGLLEEFVERVGNLERDRSAEVAASSQHQMQALTSLQDMVKDLQAQLKSKGDEVRNCTCCLALPNSKTALHLR